MNTQTTYTLLSNRFSLIRNSIYSKVAVTTILSIVVTSFLLALYLFYINLSETKKYEQQTVTGQIKHTLSLTESRRLTANFNFIAKSIKHIPLVESVILFDKSCKPITQIPLNADNKTICNSKENSNDWIYYEINDPFSELYVVSVLVKSSALALASKNIIFIVLIVVTFSMLSGLLIIFHLKKYFKDSFDNIISLILNLSPEEKGEDSEVELPLELKPIKESLLNTKKDLQDANVKIVEQAKTQATAELCLQIAHDIRSPLPALEMISEEIQRTGNISVGDDKILKMCVNRISDIANQLLGQKDQLLVSPIDESIKESETKLISTLIEPIITEKRISVNQFDNVEIDFHIEKKSYGTFATLDAKKFQALLANLIQNSIEAVQNKINGIINLTLSTDETRLFLDIKDNGDGVKNEDIERIKQKGVTIGKKGGTGLGLYHAIQDIESFGGKLDLSSELGVGTNISISLKKSSSPEWFCENLNINRDATIVILDDDSSIHEIWEKKASSLPFSVRLKHFKHVQNFKNWYQQNKSELDYLLCDLELGRNIQTGFEVIKELNLSKKSTLVTSWHQDLELQKNAISLGLKILPKELISSVLISKLSLRAVLIDDDEITRFNWKQSAKNNHLNILTYNSIKDFIKESVDLCRKVPIYIDSSLGNNVKGEEASEEIYEMGFQTIFISTGHKRETIQDKPWIKDIVDKKPPWT